MKVQPTNYCRSMVKQLQSTIGMPSLPGSVRQYYCSMIDLAKSSQKFIMPNGGRVCDDREFKGIDMDGVLHLPYEFVAIEYFSKGFPTRYSFQTERVSRRILFARQYDDIIVINFCWWYDSMGKWVPTPHLIGVPRSNFYGGMDKGQPIWLTVISLNAGMEGADLNPEDYSEELGVLMSLLNILNCSNVKTERICSAKKEKPRKAMEFDEYHILTINAPEVHGGEGRSGSSHRSPESIFGAATSGGTKAA